MPQCAGLQQRKAVAFTSAHRTRSLLVITCSKRPRQNGGISQIFERCSLNVQQLWAAALHQHPHTSRHKWQQSLGIGAGLGAVACSGAGGADGPPGNSGWGLGGGGSGWGPSAGGSSSWGSNVLADVAAAGEAADAAAAVEEVILLDVGGMKCGGCVGHVKQLLEQHPSVFAATVNLATETALVRVKLEAGADLTVLAAELAKVLSKAGFPATVSKKAKTAAMKGQ